MNIRPIRPIRTEADNAAALKEVALLMAADPERGSPDGDRLDVLVTLVQAFEARHYPMPPADPPSRRSSSEWSSRG